MKILRALMFLCATWLAAIASGGMAQPATGGSAAPAQTDPRIDPRADTGPLPRPDVQAGDEWMYRSSSGETSRAVRQSVTEVREDSISLKTDQPGSLDSSTAVHDRNWGLLASGFNDYRPALAYYSFPLYPGKRWGVDSTVSNFGAGQSGRMHGEARAVGWEEVEVPAGRFLAMKVEIAIDTADPGDPKRTVSVRETHWYARVVLRSVKVVSEATVAGGATRRETIELLSYRIE